MSYVLAAIVGLHGAVHGLGFVSTFRLGTGVPLMSPTLLSGLDPDGLVARALGLLWLVPVAGFGLAAIGLALDLPIVPLLATSAVLSLGLCVIWWSDAKIGAFVDVAILAGLLWTWLRP